MLMYMHSGCGLIHKKPFDVCVRVGGGGGGLDKPPTPTGQAASLVLPTRCETAVCGSNSPVILDFSSEKNIQS